jgi:hypothetical protein
MPYIGSYHSEKTNYYCIQQKVANCQNSIEREMHLNPIFWFPYIASYGSDLLAKTTGGESDIIIPAIEFSKNPQFIPILLTALYWYIAAGLMVLPLSKDEKAA